jgi:hypothetical protein
MTTGWAPEWTHLTRQLKELKKLSQYNTLLNKILI